MNGAENARHAARAVAAAHSATPRLTAPHAVHVTTLPRFALYAARTLPQAAQLTYLHLWFALAEIHGSTCPRWIWHTDAQLTTRTGLSRRTLTRCRPELEERGLIHWTRNTGTTMPTWYLLRWPPPPPPKTPPEWLGLWADERAAAGEPLSPRDAWAALIPRACGPEFEEPVREWCRRPNPSSARRLNPWARLQLAEWADVDAYRSLYPKTLCLPFEPR